MNSRSKLDVAEMSLESCEIDLRSCPPLSRERQEKPFKVIEIKNEKRTGKVGKKNEEKECRNQIKGQWNPAIAHFQRRAKIIHNIEICFFFYLFNFEKL